MFDLGDIFKQLIDPIISSSYSSWDGNCASFSLYRLDVRDNTKSGHRGTIIVRLKHDGVFIDQEILFDFNAEFAKFISPVRHDRHKIGILQ